MMGAVILEMDDHLDERLRASKFMTYFGPGFVRFGISLKPMGKAYGRLKQVSTKDSLINQRSRFLKINLTTKKTLIN